MEILKKLLFLYKKNKELNIINFNSFLTEYYFQQNYKSKDSSLDKIYDRIKHT